jgi:hypothetical protein
MLFGLLPQNLLEAALLTYRPICPRDDITDNSFLKMFMLPLRVAVYSACVALFYPIMLGGAVLSAIYIRATKGDASDILRTSLSASFKAGASYPCIFVFKKPFTDQAKLREALDSIAHEIGMSTEKVNLVFESETPCPFPKGAALAADHYVDKVHD